MAWEKGAIGVFLSRFRDGQCWVTLRTSNTLIYFSFSGFTKIDSQLRDTDFCLSVAALASYKNIEMEIVFTYC